MYLIIQTNLQVSVLSVEMLTYHLKLLPMLKYICFPCKPTVCSVTFNKLRDDKFRGKSEMGNIPHIKLPCSPATELRAPVATI